MNRLAWLCVVFAAAVALAQQPVPDFRGRTVNAKEEPVRKVTLTLRPVATGPAGDPLPPYSAQSDSEGKFEFYGVAPGRYRLTAERAGYLTSSFGARATWSPGSVVAIAPGHPTGEAIVHMTEQCVLAGRVVTETGAPATTAQVVVFRQGIENGRRTLVRVNGGTTNAAGEFSFNKLPPGRYYVAGSPLEGVTTTNDAQQAMRYTTTYYPGVVDRSAAEAVVLRPAETITNLQISLRQSPVFHVRGTMGSLEGSVRAQILLTPAGEPGLVAVRAAATVAPDGAFDVAGVLPGSYTLLALRLNGSTESIVRQAVEVRSDVNGLVLSAAPGMELHGSVHLEGGVSAPAMRVELRPEDGLTLLIPRAQADRDGTFVMRGVMPGRYLVQVTGTPAGAYVKSIAVGEKQIPGNMFVVNADAAGSRFRISVAQDSGAVEGTVEAAGEPAAALVTLVPEPASPDETELYQVADTDQEGHFRIDGVRPGKYRAFAWESLDQDAQYDTKFLRDHEESSVVVDVGEKSRNEVRLQRIPANQ